MKTRPSFDLLRTEIGAGTTLIEASAGTGKTFTIAGLVLRLLLERPELTIDRILVTTFTELATAELRGRIRALLLEAVTAFRTGRSTVELLSHLLATHRDHRTATQRLDDALVNFDEAPVYTIHGFCQRVLAERAFESGTLFDAELVTNQSDLLREIVQDFWRLHFYGGERIATLLALRNGISPHHLVEQLEELTRNPLLRILPNEWRPASEIARDLSAQMLELRQHWRDEEEMLRALFADGSWAVHSHAKPEKMLPLLDDLARCLSADGGTVAQFDCLEEFATSKVTTRVRAGHAQPRFRVFEGCEKLLKLESEFRIALRAEFFTYARAELRKRKAAQNVFSYDDLLTRLHEALAARAGAELAAAIRTTYGAALIDEFQDTDPVQYSIFDRIYRGSDAPIAFIGDPKQAIYAFRGADVFTYLGAAANASQKFTLSTNWRSESGLIAAVNTIFDRERPFLLDEIEFEPVAPSRRADDDVLLVGGKQEPPFHLWLAEKDGDVPEQVAAQIVTLLRSRATIGGKPLEPRHIAVLTSTNGQAAQMQDALRARRVPSVLYSSANVFLTEEARELRDVLAAVAQPSYDKFVRAALCTDALGRTANDLDAFAHDDTAWETELLRFQKHYEIWRERGFIQMLRQLAVEHGVRRRLLSYPDGERRLTNFLHLAELLHGGCVEHQLGMNGVLKWLGQQMQGKQFAEREEHELRLESDEKAVRIITVHKSKGLEFDVTFCPFVWWSGRTRRTFHDPAADNELTLDLVDPESHKPRQEEEARAEQLRQFYVALTRAKHRCTIVWRAPAKEDKSAPAYLLGSAAALPPEITESAHIAVASLPQANDTMWASADDTAAALQPRAFKGAVDRSWGVASFTRLVSGHEVDPLDEGIPAEPGSDGDFAVAEGIHAFPKGLRAGTCLHEILEQIDFADLGNVETIAAQRLRAYSIDGFDEVVAQNVRSLAALPLATAGGEHFRLADVPNNSRIAELQFSFPVDALTVAKLTQVLAIDNLSPAIERLQFQPVNGFMNGFIDLTFEHGGRFYFADWKSNWLGRDTRAYEPPPLAHEMQRNYYTLQLCIYSVALHRYLGVRKQGYRFEEHFGGAYYIFLRGIDLATPARGVHFDRLRQRLVEQLSAVFDG